MNLKGIGKYAVTALNYVKPKVKVHYEAYLKMLAYIRECSTEIGWLGTVKVEGNDIVITDVFLFEQQASAVTCEITSEALAKFGNEVFEKYDTEKAMDIVNNLRLWGHSHVNMGVFASGQDDTQLNDFSSSGYDYFLRVIGNKKGEFEYTLAHYSKGIKIVGLDWEVMLPNADSLNALVKQEVKDKVKPMPTAPRVWSGTNHITTYQTSQPKQNSKVIKPIEPYDWTQLPSIDDYLAEQQEMALLNLATNKQESLDCFSPNEVRLISTLKDSKDKNILELVFQYIAYDDLSYMISDLTIEEFMLQIFSAQDAVKDCFEAGEIRSLYGHEAVIDIYEGIAIEVTQFMSELSEISEPAYCLERVYKLIKKDVEALFGDYVY